VKCPCEEEEQTANHLIFHSKILRNQKNTRGNWRTKNETLVNNYLQIFVKFDNSMDFRLVMTLHYKNIDRQISENVS